LINLLSNAIKFSRKDETIVTKVHTAEIDSKTIEVEISVQD